MDIEALRYLVTLCETRSFSKTAELHYISTSTCSRKIRNLEEETGYTFFIRDSHTVTPTPAGLEMRDIAKRMLSMINHLDKSDLERMDGTYGQIRLAMDPWDRGTAIEPYLAAFLQQNPRSELVFKSATMAQIETGLLNHTFDAGLLIRPKGCADRRLDYAVIKAMGLVAWVHKDHPLACRSSVMLNDLVNCRIALFDRNRSPLIYDHIIAQMNRRISLTWICHVDHANHMLMMCCVNKYVGICSPIEVDADRKDFKVLPICDEPDAFEYVIAIKKGLRNEHVRSLCRMIERYAGGL